jgi:hypothetical protein
MFERGNGNPPNGNAPNGNSSNGNPTNGGSSHGNPSNGDPHNGHRTRFSELIASDRAARSTGPGAERSWTTSRSCGRTRAA